MRSLLKFSFGLILVIAYASSPVLAQGNAGLTAIGEVVMTKGVVTARSGQRALTALAKGSPVYLKDIIETASRSFTVIKFSDGGKVTLRPDTRFDLNEYDTTAGQEKESFALLKGGLRAVTGAIGKANPEQVKYTARNTTIGIRGTTFVVKLCEEGTEGCRLSEGLSDPNGLSNQGDSTKYVDIFVIDKSGGTAQRITRQELEDLLLGVYVAVIDGSIRVETPDWYIDMLAGDKCVVGSTEGGGMQSGGGRGVECFVPGPGLESTDIFLTETAEKITGFNLYDDTEILAGSELCEIN
ncbi:MAG: FecR domain-containing protein [Gammaproteobacteria bacterium]|nr:FecR domain-containing protein [Gammaproteobacteria bacterium]